jgi:hypothetical protein
MYKDRSLLCTTNNEKFDSAQYAAKALGVQEQDIILACGGYYREVAFNNRFEFIDLELQIISNKLLYKTSTTLAVRITSFNNHTISKSVASSKRHPST